MLKTFTQLLIWLFVLSLTAPAAAEKVPKQLTFAATNWCPYICDSPEKKGFIVDYLTELLATRDIELTVEILPWSRAIMAARNGQYDGLLTSTPIEAPSFHFPQQPTGIYQMCFFSGNRDVFIYTGRNSLKGVTLGVVKDYGYGEPLDSVINRPEKDEYILSVASSAPLKQLVNLAKVGRVDLFIEDSMVMAHYQLIHQEAAIQQLDCFNKIPFFTAISPQHTASNELTALFNELLSSQQASKLYLKKQNAYKM